MPLMFEEIMQIQFVVLHNLYNFIKSYNGKIIILGMNLRWVFIVTV